MEKTQSTPKAIIEGEPTESTPTVEPNGFERTILSGEDDRPHSSEPERVVEWGGPNNRYGKGAYKVVYKAIDKEEGIEVAWNACQTTRNEFNEISEEVDILKKVRHPNIITLYDSWYANGEFVFITELMTSGTLREYVQKLKNPTTKIIRRWVRQILKGLIYLHTQSPPIIHRDIKCDNLFVNGSHGEIKIGDMGTAKMRFGKKYTVIGTPEFMAPEMYEERGYSEKVDIYAFGMCLLEMVTGEYPYAECKNAAQIYKKVTSGAKPDCLSKVQDKEILSMITCCLAPESERWSAKKLADHPFLLEDPEVILVSANDNKTKLKLQVLFKGHDKHSIKFEYNRDTDTAEDVVREMIEEKVLLAKHQGIVCNEIHRILKDLAKNPPAPSEKHSSNSPAGGSMNSPVEALKNEERSTHRRTPSELLNEHVGGTITIPLNRNRSRPRPEGGDAEAIARGISSMSVDSPNIVGSGNGLRRSSISNMDLKENFDLEAALKEFPNEMSLEDFVTEVATLCNRPVEKALEWANVLKNQDLMTVGDLRDLHDEDWNRLTLTVFATRALRNALRGTKIKTGLEFLSPRNTSRPGLTPVDNVPVSQP